MGEKVTYSRRKSDKKPLHIVTIGGGTGSFAILSELRKQRESGKNIKISAIVSMSDSGGSTGVLMDDYGVLPPGDVRQCLVALSSESKFLRDLFLYRYEKEHGFLGGQNFGNIFLSTIEKITNSFPKAVREAEKILHTQGRTYPVTISKNTLIAEKENGEKIESEDSIDHGDVTDIKNIYLEGNNILLNQKIPSVLEEADIILVNPGSFYGSTLPNFLVEGLSDEIQKSTAKKIFITNMVTEKKHTDDFTVLTFLEKMEQFGNFSDFDQVLYNTNYDIDKQIEKRYEEEGKFFIQADKKLS